MTSQIVIMDPINGKNDKFFANLRKGCEMLLYLFGLGFIIFVYFQLFTVDLFPSCTSYVAPARNSMKSAPMNYNVANYSTSFTGHMIFNGHRFFGSSDYDERILDLDLTDVEYDRVHRAMTYEFKCSLITIPIGGKMNDIIEFTITFSPREYQTTTCKGQLKCSRPRVKSAKNEQIEIRERNLHKSVDGSIFKGKSVEKVEEKVDYNKPAGKEENLKMLDNVCIIENQDAPCLIPFWKFYHQPGTLHVNRFILNATGQH